MRRSSRRHGRGSRRSRMLAAFGGVFIAMLIVVPGAFASTLTIDASGALTYQGASGQSDSVTFSQALPLSVQIQTFDNDPITSAPGNCTNNNPPAGSSFSSDYTCTSVTSLTGNGSDKGPDFLDASGRSFFSPGNGAPITVPTTLNGGNGNDFLLAGTAGATLNGGNGDDTLNGGPGNDTLNGGAGNDTLVGDNTTQFFRPSGAQPSNQDTLNGGDGNDTLYPSNGTNQVSGGAGIDEVLYSDNVFVPGSGGTPDSYVATPVNVSLDGVANDGYAGNNSNINTDVEDVSVFDNANCADNAFTPCAYGNATLTGDSGPNSLSGGSGNDTITGGDGADFLSGNGGNNTLNAVDGFPDRVDCGGTGTANVDQLDSVFSCTTVNKTTVTNAGLIKTPPVVAPDKAPRVAWTAPPENAALSYGKKATLSVTVAPGDHPVTQVLFYVGERMVCDVKAAPYTCSYTPIKGDIGKDTLLATATDSIGLTGTAARTVRVNPFNGALLLKSSRLIVRKGKLSATFKCASSLSCNFRFSIVIHARLAKSHRTATLVFLKSSTTFKRIRAGKTATVTAGVNPAGLSVLKRAHGHSLSGKLSTRPQSAQRGIIKVVRLVLK